MDRPLVWLDTGERAFVREIEGEPGRPRRYTVDDPTGQTWVVGDYGEVVEGTPRVLGNVPNEQLLAEGRLAIKKAQADRRRRREQAALEQLADLNPALFGSF